MKKMSLLEGINPHIQSMWMAKDMIKSIVTDPRDGKPRPPQMIQKGLEAALAASRGDPQDVFPDQVVDKNTYVMVANELRRYLER